MHLSFQEQRVPVRAFLFDKDGTLVHHKPMLLALAKARRDELTKRMNRAIANEWEDNQGVDIAGQTLDPLGPLAMASKHEEVIITAALLYRHGWGWREAKETAEQCFQEAEGTMTSPYGATLIHGTVNVLKALRYAGLRIGIATTDTHRRTEAMLGHFGIAHFVSAVVAADDVWRLKPAPEMVFRACQRLECEPSTLVVVGDNMVDIEMGRAAGVAACIGVTSGVTPPSELATVADIVIPSIASIELRGNEIRVDSSIQPLPQERGNSHGC